MKSDQYITEDVYLGAPETYRDPVLAGRQKALREDWQCSARMGHNTKNMYRFRTATPCAPLHVSQDPL
jgi:hypothetical protein